MMAPQIGHMGFKKIQFLMRTGVLANTEATKSLHTSACKLTTYPLCVAGHLQAKEAQWSRMLKATKKDKLFPGQGIAVDYYNCSTKGRLFSSRGKPKDTNMYTGGALFMDMSSK